MTSVKPAMNQLITVAAITFAEAIKNVTNHLGELTPSEVARLKTLLDNLSQKMTRETIKKYQAKGLPV